MKTTSTTTPARAPASNVLNLQAERQRRAARRMASQTIAVLCSYPCLQQFVRIV
jgi:hypothetical protein